MAVKPATFGELKRSGYTGKTIRQELRDNLLQSFRNKTNPFTGIIGYDNTVIPDVQKAILAGHNINFLGLRGQAKTRMARLMVNLLDEYIPVIKGSALNEDPFHPITLQARDLVQLQGDDMEIEWLHRDERYAEKLATPDVSVADLIGDIDPIKAAHMKLSFSDERVMHFGMIPRSNRCIFVINELPDLQARIQVALFNILQEGDVQIRGFKIRLPLDIQFVFTANPEDYTNRGSIVTPLKDRIESQILTHYPRTIEEARAITELEAHLAPEQEKLLAIDDTVKDLLEQINFEARKSEYVDAKSGVSARMSISAYELLVSTMERRMLLNDEPSAQARISDLLGIVPAINGKIELVYEGEQEGQYNVAYHLIGKAVRTMFSFHFPDPERIKRKKETNPYLPVIEWFGKGHELEFTGEMPQQEYAYKLREVDGLEALVKKYFPKAGPEQSLLLMEFVLFGMAEYSLISRHIDDDVATFSDIFNSVFSDTDEDEEY